MDIVGLLPVAATHKKFPFVAMNYFSKWVETETYANIKDKDIPSLSQKILSANLESYKQL